MGIALMLVLVTLLVYMITFRTELEENEFWIGIAVAAVLLLLTILLEAV